MLCCLLYILVPLPLSLALISILIFYKASSKLWKINLNIINTQWDSIKKGDSMNYCIIEYLAQEIVISYWCWRPQRGLREGLGFLEITGKSWMYLNMLKGIKTHAQFSALVYQREAVAKAVWNHRVL